MIVVAGSFSLDAVEAVCGDRACPPEQAIDLMSALIDKSLVISELRGDSSRYRLLETIRQYALAPLNARGDAEAVRARLAAYYVALAETLEPKLFGGANDLRLQALLEDELPSIRAVEEWCRLDPARSVDALRIGAALHWFWFAQGRFREGRSWLESALAGDGGTPKLVRAKALIALGHVAVWQGDAASVRAPLEEAVAMLRHLDAPRTLIVALIGLAIGAPLMRILVVGARGELAASVVRRLSMSGRHEVRAPATDDRARIRAAVRERGRRAVG